MARRTRKSRSANRTGRRCSIEEMPFRRLLETDTELGEYCGLDNYEALFDDPQFRGSAGNTVRFTVWVVPLQTALALALAVWTNGSAVSRRALRIAVLVPTVIALTVLSVVGRTGFNMPVLGDTEIVEVGVAFSIFSFLAYCQMRGANVIVDFFTRPLPLSFRNALDAISNLLFAVVVLVLTWRLDRAIAVGRSMSGDSFRLRVIRSLLESVERDATLWLGIAKRLGDGITEVSCFFRQASRF